MDWFHGHGAFQNDAKLRVTFSRYSTTCWRPSRCLAQQWLGTQYGKRQHKDAHRSDIFWNSNDSIVFYQGFTSQLIKYSWYQMQVYIVTVRKLNLFFQKHPFVRQFITLNDHWGSWGLATWRVRASRGLQGSYPGKWPANFHHKITTSPLFLN